MITPAEVTKLFGTRDFQKETRDRLNRKMFPPALICSQEFDVPRVMQEYESLVADFKKKPTAFENQVVSDALGFSKTFIAHDGQDYWPLSISDYSREVWEVQELIDSRRGLSWRDHQSTLSVSRRITSLKSLNEDYDPIIDERLCMEFDPRLKGTYIEELLLGLKGRPTRTRFVFLNPGDRVSLHSDYDPSYSIRMHFPITTNEGCFNGYKFDGKLYRFHMNPGTRYIVNNGIPHFAENLGTTGRLHLIVSIDGQEDYLWDKEGSRVPPVESVQEH